MTTRTERFPIDNELLAMTEESLVSDHMLTRSGWLDDEDEVDGDSGAYQLAAGVAVVRVSGPLLTNARASWFSSWDGYDSVAARVCEAMADPAVGAVVMSFDSPGGMAVGMVDGARAIRQAADLWGKPLVAHGTMAASAAYGLACACDEIFITADGTMGSIGTMATITDRSKQNESQGLNVVVLTSGSQKTDGHPDVPLTAAAVSRLKTRITMLSQMFGAWVSERRPKCADPLALQGASIHGEAAVAAGLADGVGTLDDAISHAAALATARATPVTSNNARTTPMQTSAQLLLILTSLRAELGVTDDAEALAALKTLKVRAGQADAAQAQLVELRAQLEARTEADRARARDEVLAKHRARGALTPAMEADAGYMATLNALDAAAVDRVLSPIAGLPTAPITPRRTGIDPASASEDPKVDPKAPNLSPEEREWSADVGVRPEAIEMARRDEALRARRRQGSDD